MKQNRADIKRDDILGHPAKDSSDFQVKLAGQAFTPWGFDYQGSAVVHYYKKQGTTDFAFASQTVGFQDISEGQADVGLKELRRTLMGNYGREDKRRTDTKEEIL